MAIMTPHHRRLADPQNPENHLTECMFAMWPDRYDGVKDCTCDGYGED